MSKAINVNPDHYKVAGRERRTRSGERCRPQSGTERQGLEVAEQQKTREAEGKGKSYCRKSDRTWTTLYTRARTVAAHATAAIMWSPRSRASGLRSADTA